MNSFSISELQQFSGIKAHTIRIWEQRYQALEPDRTGGNARFYNGNQLRRLLNITSLLSTGYKISYLCTLPDKELNELIAAQIEESTSSNPAHEQFINKIIAAALTYDEKEFDALYQKCIKLYKLRDTYVNVLYPALVRLGLMWSNDSLRPAHEHFITHLMRKKIMSATDQLPHARNARQTWLLFLPEDEFHETGLLFSEFLIRESGKNVIYLGADVHIDTLESAVTHVHPTHLLTFLVRHHEDDDDARYVKKLIKHFKQQKINIACDSTRLTGVKSASNTHLLRSVQDLENILKS